MIENHVMATVNTLIPKASITPLEMKILSAAFLSKEDTNDLVYFYAENGFLTSVDTANITADKNSLDQGYYDNGQMKKTVDVDFVFQNIITRDDSLDSVSISGAYISNEMTLGGFGGFATFITKDDVAWSNSDKFILDQQKLLESKRPDVTLSTEDGSHWFYIDDANGDGVSINLDYKNDGLCEMRIYNKGYEDRDPVATGSWKVCESTEDRYVKRGALIKANESDYYLKNGRTELKVGDTSITVDVTTEGVVVDGFQNEEHVLWLSAGFTADDSERNGPR